MNCQDLNESGRNYLPGPSVLNESGRNSSLDLVVLNESGWNCLLGPEIKLTETSSFDLRFECKWQKLLAGTWNEIDRNFFFVPEDLNESGRNCMLGPEMKSDRNCLPGPDIWLEKTGMGQVVTYTCMLFILFSAYASFSSRRICVIN